MTTTKATVDIPFIQGEKIWDLSCITDRAEADIRRIELCSIIRFQGYWYCAFREGAIHNLHPSGRARVIRSAEGRQWQTASVFDWDGGDVRDPRLSKTSEGCLMLNAGVMFVSPKPRQRGERRHQNSIETYTPPEGLHVTDEQDLHYPLDWIGTVLNLPENDQEPNVASQSMTWLSHDGTNWSSAYACPSGVNTWRWDVTWHQGMGYSLAQWGKDCRGPLYRTRDGKSWRILTDQCAPEGRCNEGSLVFGEDGTAYGLLRGPRNAGAMLGVSLPPHYQEWKWVEPQVDFGPGYGLLPAGDAFRVSLGGPKIIRLSDGRLVGTGRALGPGRDDGRATLFWVDPDKAVFRVFAEFDGTSYPGIAEHDGKIWIAYIGSACHQKQWEVHWAGLDIPAPE